MSKDDIGKRVKIKSENKIAIITDYISSKDFPYKLSCGKDSAYRYSELEFLNTSQDVFSSMAEGEVLEISRITYTKVPSGFVAQKGDSLLFIPDKGFSL